MKRIMNRIMTTATTESFDLAFIGELNSAMSISVFVQQVFSGLEIVVLSNLFKVHLCVLYSTIVVHAHENSCFVKAVH